jgi:hypothetical protein
MTTSTVSTIIAEPQHGNAALRYVTRGKAIRGIAGGSLFIWIRRAAPTLTNAIALGKSEPAVATKYLSEAQAN